MILTYFYKIHINFLINSLDFFRFYHNYFKLFKKYLKKNEINLHQNKKYT